MAANNIHLPDDLLSEVIAAAQALEKSAGRLGYRGHRRYLEHKALDDLAARGRID